ncbi:unnamed protein product [Didymodactylos carnosus]|nr:unnamed protein product [Didymodactylos carnosus]CAF1236822.1 unnamed protein product [Didymodactylos carnosus]CAF3654712.1 unnamed protein product [Didymodactylos carnosus]CAF3999183.1 unnamed protein product [Didymodactylos carnosus]
MSLDKVVDEGDVLIADGTSVRGKLGPAAKFIHDTNDEDMAKLKFIDSFTDEEVISGPDDRGKKKLKTTQFTGLTKEARSIGKKN